MAQLRAAEAMRAGEVNPGANLKRPYFRQFCEETYLNAFLRSGIDMPGRIPSNGNPFLGLRGVTQVHLFPTLFLLHQFSL